VPAALADEFLVSSADVTPAAYCADLNPPPEKAIPTREKLLLKTDTSYPICEPVPSQSCQAFGITVDSRAPIYALSCGCRVCDSAVNSRKRGFRVIFGHSEPVPGA